jgi:hypothetical protein
MSRSKVKKLVTRTYSPTLPASAVKRPAPFPRFGFVAWDYMSPGGYGNEPIALVAFGRDDWADHVPPIVCTSDDDAKLAAKDY